MGSRARDPENPFLIDDGAAGERQPLTGNRGALQEAGADDKLNDFSENGLRLGFIRKVYGLLTAQILLTILIATPFRTWPDLNEFAASNPQLLWIALAASLVFICLLTCIPEAARTFPNNYLLLFGFTITEAFLVGVITAQYETSSVFVAMTVTCGITAVLTAFACTGSVDFTGYGIYGLVASVALLLVGLMAIIVQIPMVTTLWLCFGILLFCFYIVYDTQLIVGGRHAQFKFGIDDYVLATLCLYLDIINLFLYILSADDTRV